MVLERLIDVQKALKSPKHIFALGAIISFISLFVSYMVFPESTGLFTTIIITLAMVPFINRMLRYEEFEDEKIMDTHSFFQRYGDVITAYIAFFCGMILAMSFAFLILPESITEKVFDEQINEIQLIRGRFTFGNTFLDIFSNNMSVLMLSFLFSFLFGSGAVFILTWNASVLSAAIGLVARASGGLAALPAAVSMFLPHGSFEIVAYFIGAIAGGLISAAVTRKRSTRFWDITRDSMRLLVFSVLFLIIGGFIETVIILFP